MRRLLATALAAAALVPATNAHAIDPLCETAGQVYGPAGCDYSEWELITALVPVEEIVDALPLHLVPWYDFSLTPGTLVCERVYGTLPGTGAPVNESGSASCTWAGGAADTWFSASVGEADATFRYFGYAADDTLASGAGYFTVESPNFGLYASGTYTRAGGTWAFSGSKVWRAPGRSYPAPPTRFAAVGTGLPTTPGYAFELTGT